MNRDVEERIVAMYFDNADFEKNAKTTIDTLGQLKNNLNFEESAKGLSVFEKVGKTLNFDKAARGVTKIKSTLTGMGGILKKVFNLTPIDEAASAVMNFKNRYLDRVIGFDLANKIVNSLESAFRSLTIQPISAGWNQYESKMDSVKTIMSSTGESIDVVEQHLNNLTDYANKTIYSLVDMTSNLGKFTNNGMKLEDSVKAMEGIANAAADAGQGAAQASMAMYNFSQAMGVGKMTTMDWKSIENANMATTKLKNTFIEMAAAQGNLRKEYDETDKTYHYYIDKNTKGQTLKNKKDWTEVTAKNFRETLSKDWLDAQSMMHALMIYSGEAIDPDTLASWGISDPEQIKRFQELGEEAMEAAVQVRTFTKMMDALKESVQSGWADSFQLIFGNMEEGTTLWTSINKEIDGILNKSTESRNKILKEWSETREVLGTQTVTKHEDTTEEEEAISKLQEKAKLLQDKLDADENRFSEKEKVSVNKEISEVNKDLKAKQREVEAIKKKLKKADTEMTHGERKQAEDDLKKLEKEIEEDRKKSDKLKKKLEDDKGAKMSKKERELALKDLEEYEREIEQLQKIIDRKTANTETVEEKIYGKSGRDVMIEGLMEVINLLKEFGKTISDSFADVFGTMDGQKLYDLTLKIRDGIKGVTEWFGKADEEGSRMNKIKKILTGVFSVLKAVAKIFKTIVNLAVRILRPKIDWFLDIFAKVGDFFKDIGNMSIPDMFAKIGEGLKTVWEKVKKFFSPKDIYDEKGMKVGTELPVITWLKNLWNNLKATVKQWANDIGLGNVWTTVSGWWTTIKNTLEEGRKTLEGVWETLKGWFDESGIGEFLSNTWNWITSQFRPRRLADENGHELSTQKAPIVTWLEDIWESVSKFWNDTIIGTAKPIWEAIRQFGENTWGWIKAQFEQEKNDKGEVVREAPIVSWLQGIWDSVHKFWDDTILGTARPIWLAISTFGQNTWAWISSQFKPSRLADENGHELSNQDPPIVRWLKGIWETVSNFWNNTILGTARPIWFAISTFAQNTWAWISSQFKPRRLADENGHELSHQDPPIVSWLKDIWDGIVGIWNDIVGWPIWNDISTFAKNTWVWISSQFKPKRLADENGHELSNQDPPIVSWLKGIWDGIVGIWNNIVGWPIWNDISTFAQSTWVWISSQFKPKRLADENGHELSNREAPIVTWLKDIWENVQKTWKSVIEWEGWAKIGEFLSNTWNWIVNLLSGNSAGESGGSTKKSKTSAKDNPIARIRSKAKEGKKAASETETVVSFLERIVNAIGGFFERIGTAIANITINKQLTDFFNAVGTFLGGLIDVFSRLLTGLGDLMKTGNAGKNLWLLIGTGLSLIIGAIFNLVNNIFKAKIATNSESFTKKFLEISAGIFLLAAGVTTLTAIDEGKVWSAVGVIAAIGVVIGGIIGVLSNLKKNSVSNDAPVTSTERVLGKLIDTVGKIGLVWLVLEKLPNIIKTIGEVKKDLGGVDIGSDILNTLLGVTTLISAVGLLFAVLNKIAPKGLDVGATAKTAASMMVGLAIIITGFEAILGLIGGIANLFGGDKNVEDTIKIIEDGGKILNAIGRALYSFVFGLFGGKTDEQKAEESLAILNLIGDKLSTFDTEKVAGISRMMTLISNLTNGYVKFDSSKMAGFAEAIGQLGTGVYNFARYLGMEDVDETLTGLYDTGSETYQKLTAYMGLGKMIGEMFTSFATPYLGDGLRNLRRLAEDDNLETFMENLKKILTKLGDADLPDTGIQFDGLEIAKKLFDAIQIGLSDPSMPKFDAASVVTSICEALKIGKDAIALIVHEMVQDGLTDHGGDFSTKEGSDAENKGVEQIVSGILGDNGFDVTKLASGGGLDGITSALESALFGTDGKSGMLGDLTAFKEGVPSLGSIFGDKGWLNFTDENGQPIDLTTELTTQITDLTGAMDGLDGLIKVRITPVIDTSELTPEKLQEALNNRLAGKALNATAGFGNPTVSIDFTGLNEALGMEEIKNKLEEIRRTVVMCDENNTTSIVAIGNGMNDVADSIGNMKLVLDTGALVGYITPMIDQRLGSMVRVFGRTGVGFSLKH